MRTSINGTGGRLIVSAVGGQVVITITDGQTSQSIAVEPHVGSLIASETLRTSVYAEHHGGDGALYAARWADRQEQKNVLGFPVGAPV